MLFLPPAKFLIPAYRANGWRARGQICEEKKTRGKCLKTAPTTALFLSFFLFFFFSYTLSCREVHAGFGEARIVLAGACICLICVAPDAAKPVNHLPHLPQHNLRPHRGPSSIPHLFMPSRRCATSRVRTSPGEVFFEVTRGPPLLALPLRHPSCAPFFAVVPTRPCPLRDSTLSP